MTRHASPMARLMTSLSQATNSRGIYLGARGTKLHVAIYRGSRGRLGAHFPGCPEVPILLIDHVGARSGVRRTSPLIYLQDGERFAIVASKAGEPTHPAWFHNLRAHPYTTIQVGSVVHEVRARLATGDERQRLWPSFVTLFPSYEFYRRRAQPRELPIVILEPR